MGVRVIVGREGGDYGSPEYAILFDSTTGTAFGPLITDWYEDEINASGGWEWCLEVAEAFIKWVPHDLRSCGRTTYGALGCSPHDHYTDFLDAVNKHGFDKVVEELGGLE